jgi:hypothetical protein
VTDERHVRQVALVENAKHVVGVSIEVGGGDVP